MAIAIPTKLDGPPAFDSLGMLGWLVRSRGRQGLSPTLSRTLVAAAEALLAPQLNGREVRAICRTVQVRAAHLPPAEYRALCGQLELLEHLVPLFARCGRRFHRLSRDQRRKCLRRCERSRWAMLSGGEAQLRHLVAMAQMETPEVWPLAVGA